MMTSAEKAARLHSVTFRDGLYWVVDFEGYEISYVGFVTKAEALESARANDDWLYH